MTTKKMFLLISLLILVDLIISTIDYRLTGRFDPAYKLYLISGIMILIFAIYEKKLLTSNSKQRDEPSRT